MSGRVYLAGVGIALVGLALGVTDWALSLQPGVTEANVRRIRTGKTRGEAEAILGGPPQEGCSWRGWRHLNNDGTVAGRVPDGAQAIWESPHGRAEVHFDQRDRVERATWLAWGEPPGFLARLRAWLGW